ncbi:hypothetical protein OG21DRAFT_1524753 [Imleria badia]|nr:hypothetical protein OG21DRAFT_1524753 [Imleria badia]
MGAWVDYSARLMEGFNWNHNRQCNQMHNRSSAAHSKPSPVFPPPQNPQIHQHVSNFQHEAEDQRYIQAQQEQHSMGLQQLHQQLQEHQHHMQFQQELAQRHQLEHQRLLELQQQDCKESSYIIIGLLRSKDKHYRESNYIIKELLRSSNRH